MQTINHQHPCSYFLEEHPKIITYVHMDEKIKELCQVFEGGEICSIAKILIF